MSQQRSQARRHAVQAIYQWQMTGQNVGEILNQFLDEQEPAQDEQEPAQGEQEPAQ